MLLSIVLKIYSNININKTDMNFILKLLKNIWEISVLYSF